MDTRRLFTTLAIAVVLFFVMQPILNKWWGVAPPAAATPAALPFTPVNAVPTPSAPGAVARQIVLGDVRNTTATPTKLALTIDTVTAGIDKIQLNIKDYAETVERKDPLTLLEANPKAPRPYATIGLHVIPMDAANKPTGEELDLTGRLKPIDPNAPVDLAARAKAIADGNTYALVTNNYIWSVVEGSQTATSVQLRLVIAGYIEITKTFTIDPATYEITIAHTVKNLTSTPLSVSLDQLGSTSLPRDNPQMDDRVYDTGQLDTGKKAIRAPLDSQSHMAVAKYAGGTHDLGKMMVVVNPVVWISSGNRFFETITRPLPTAGATFTLAGGQVVPMNDQVESAAIDLLMPPSTPDDPSTAVSGERFTGATFVMPANSTLAMPLSVYCGPKKRDLIGGDPTAPVGSLPYLYNALEYGQTIHYAQSAMCAFCTFEPVAKIILQFLDILHGSIAFHNYGIAIMLLVLIVRALLHPLTRASQINMATMGKKMKLIQPKLEAAKKRYADDKKKLNEETMRIYRENEVNPAGPVLGCLPMLLQTPIWIALYAGLKVDIDLRHASFIPGWINDLSNPDTIWPHPAPAIDHPLFHVPILGFVYGLNLLPLLLVVVYYFNMKFMSSSQPTPTDDSQKQMQNISKYMIFLFPIFLYNAPSGLNVYIFMSTVGGLIDTYFIRKTLKKRGILPNSAESVAGTNPLM